MTEGELRVAALYAVKYCQDRDEVPVAMAGARPWMLCMP